MRRQTFDRGRAIVVTAFLVVVLAAWAIVSSAKLVNPLLLPNLWSVVTRFVTMLGGPTIWGDLGVTLTRIAAAFVIAMVVGLLLGVPIGRRRDTQLAYTPLLANLAAIPLFALYPVILLIFGIGDGSKIVFGALNGFFPIVLAAIAGSSGVAANLLVAARAMGASPLQRMISVILPAALPEILAGLRLGLALCTLSVFGGEILGSTSGIGYRLAAASEMYRTADVYVYILIALLLTALLSFVLSVLFRFIARK